MATLRAKQIWIMTATLSVVVLFSIAFATSVYNSRLRNEQLTLIASVDQSNYPRALVDKNGIIVAWSKGMEIITGKDREICVGYGPRHVIPDEFAEAHMKAFKNRIANPVDGMVSNVSCKMTGVGDVNISVRTIMIGSDPYLEATVDERRNVKDVEAGT